MKKVIFEGIVNGTKYDNADEYNEALVAAMKTGTWECSHSARTVDAADEDQVESDTVPDYMYPGFKHCIGAHCDDKFIGEALAQDANKILAVHKATLNEIREDISYLSNTALEKYDKNVQNIRDFIAKEKGDRINKKEALEAQINRLKKDLADTIAEIAVVSEFGETYNKIEDIVTDAQMARQEKVIVQELEKPEGDPVNDKGDELEMTLRGLMKLAKEIFPDFDK